MPLSADPTATAPYSLKRDQQIPEDRRPVFRCRFLTRGAVTTIERMLNAATKKKGQAYYDALIEIILFGVVDWENFCYPKIGSNGKPHPKAGQAAPFNPDSIHEILSGREIREAAHDYPLAVLLNEADMGNSDSHSPSAAASAETAEAASKLQASGSRSSTADNASPAAL